MKVLYISYDGMTDPLGQSQVIPYLEGLHKNGHQFWLVSCDKPEVFAKRKSVIQALMDKSNITWTPLIYHATPPVLSTIKDIRALKKVCSQIVKKNNIEIVHCRSYISALVGLQLKRKFGVKLVFDMRGFWADERVEGNIWSLSNPLFKTVYRFFKKKELHYFSEADYTISLTENGKREIHTWKSIQNNPIPIQVIPCCADLDLFSPRETDIQLQKELGINPEAKVVTYLGSIGTWYLLDEMLQFFSLYKKNETEAVFLFITGDDEQSIKDKASLLGIDTKDIIVRRANREDVPRYLSLSSFSLFFIKQSFSKKASSPTKMGEIMGMGIPVVCNSGVGDVGEIMQAVNDKAVLREFSIEAMQTVISHIEDVLAEDPQKIREVAQQFYALEKGIELYNEVYLSV